MNESVSRPCPACTEALARAGVARAVYRDGPGKTVTTRPVALLAAEARARRKTRAETPKDGAPAEPTLEIAA